MQYGERQRERHHQHRGITEDHDAAGAEPVGDRPAQQEQQHGRQAACREHQAGGGGAVRGRHPAEGEAEHHVAELGDGGRSEPQQVRRRERWACARVRRPPSDRG